MANNRMNGSKLGRRAAVGLSLLISLTYVVEEVESFLVAPTPATRWVHNDAWRRSNKPPARLAPLNDAKKWEREIDAKSREAAAQPRPGETVAGAVLGGLLLGPFGALFGASVGAGLGRQSAQSEARKQELARLGLSSDMLEAAQDIGQALERNMEGLKAVQESFDTQKRLARTLDADAEALYAKAQAALQQDNEDLARQYLLQRTQIQDKLKTVLTTCATARQQVERMEENAAVLKQRALEMDALLRRTVGAKALQDSSSAADLGLSLSNSDPLLNKFRDMGID